jgi:CelD/BcsL family acetyltransferase involved in cellulose biosynthesis
MKLALYEQDHVFTELASEWNELLARSVTDTIFLTHEWQSTWWSSYQAGELFVITCRAQEGKLVAIAPWFIHHINGERVLRTIGCVDVTDYVDLIVDKDYTEPVQSVLAAFLNEHRARYDRINLCNIPEASPNYAHFPDVLRRCGFDADVVLQEVCPVIHLPETWEGYLESLDKKQRHEIRRKLRRAESEAELEYYVVTPQHNLAEETERFLHLMKASQPSKAEFMSNPSNERFFRALTEITFARGWLKMSFLKVNGKAVAAYFDFDYGGNILVYNSGLLPTEYSHLSTGIVLLSYNIKSAIETGHKLFDFLRGNETYKYRMGGIDTRVFKLMARLDGEPHPTDRE